MPGLRGANVLLLCSAVVAASAAIFAWRRRLAWPRLAALVERRYPDLGERLLSTVEFSQQTNAVPPTLLHWLRAETIERAAPLDFQAAFTLRSVKRVMAAGGMMLFLALGLALVSETYSRFARRVLFAWSPSVYGYEIVVEPGDRYLGRGRSEVITARLQLTEPAARLPSQCVLVSYQDGVARRVRMESLEPGAFTFTWPAVEESLTYQVEAGDVVSSKHRLTVVDPVGLVGDGPKTQVTPPPYVQPEVLAPSEQSGQNSFAVLQFSKVRFQFALDRPAQKATIRWRHGDQDRERILPLDAGAAVAAWEFITLEPGAHAATLTLEGEHGILSTYPLPSWSIWTDDAPWFSAVPLLGLSSTGERPRIIAPDDVIPIKTVAEDQVGIERVELQYRINDGPVQTVPLGAGKGAVRLEIDALWPLFGLVKTGDIVKCRLCAADNRRLAQGQVRIADGAAPDRVLEPHLVYFPSREAGEDRWWQFKIEPKAESLVRQQVTGERDELQHSIDRIAKRIEEERQQVQKVRQASHQRPVLSGEQAKELNQAGALNKTSQRELLELAQKAASIPGLQKLAELGSDIAEHELAAGEDSIRAAAAKALPPEKREAELRKAEEALQAALQRLEQGKKLNDSLANERLEAEKIQKLASAEEALAKQVEQLTAGPESDPKELDRLRAEQAKIAAELEKLGQSNPRLQEMTRALRQARAQKLAQDARALAQKQRQESEASQAKWNEAAKDKAADLAKEQQALAERVIKFGKDLKGQPATALFDVSQRPAQDAAKKLRDGEIEPALTHQQNSENTLQSLGEQLDRTLVLGRDLRSSVQRLARLQDELLKQLEKLGEDYVRLPVEQTRAKLAELAQSQKALREALGKLEVPQAAAAPRQTAQQMTGEAADLLGRRDALEAFFKMEQARDALQAWGRSLPEGIPPANLGKDSPEELAVKKQAGQARQLAKEQHALREAARKLLGNIARSRSNSPEHSAQKDGLDKFALELMELAQKTDPEARHAAEAASHSAEMSQKALAKSKADKETGNMAQAKQADADAAMHLDMAAKKLDEAAQAMASQPSPDSKMDQQSSALQKAFEESRINVQQAQKQLQQQPKNAAPALQKAAQSMKQLAQQTQPSAAAAGIPKPSSNPAAAAAPAGGNSADELLAERLKSHANKSWGELPGELRTRIVQDLRARYGDEYGPIIQRYFQQIADVPGGKQRK